MSSDLASDSGIFPIFISGGDDSYCFIVLSGTKKDKLSLGFISRDALALAVITCRPTATL